MTSKRRFLALLLLVAAGVSLHAQNPQPMKINLRITQSDGPQRKADTKFRMTMTTAASLMLKDGTYYLNGSSPNRAAWRSDSETDFYDFEQNFELCADCFNQEYPNPCPFTSADFPVSWDARCGDASGMFFIRADTADGRWSYNRVAAPVPCGPDTFGRGCVSYGGMLSAGVATLSPEPARGEWPYQWTPRSDASQEFPAGGDYPNTGIPGFQDTVNGAKVRAAMGNTPGRIPAENQQQCATRISAFSPDGFDESQCATYPHPIHWNPDFKPAGTANPNAIFFGGRWYMAFTEEYNNPKPVSTIRRNFNGWTAGETWRTRWATSTDGQHWTIEPRYLFRYSDAVEDAEPYRGLFVTQLFIDNGYFYMLLNAEEDWMMLLRAPLVPNSASGYGPWQIATGGNAQYVWTPLPSDGTLDITDTLHTGTLNAAPVMPGVLGRRAAIGRIAVSPKWPGKFMYVGLSVSCGSKCNQNPQPQEMVLWTAPDLNTAFTQQQQGITFLGELGPHPNGLELQLANNDSDASRTESMYGNEFDVWMNGRAGTDTIHWFNEYRVTATLSGNIYSPRTKLRSFSGCTNGCDVALSADGSSVNTSTYGSYTFTIVNDDGASPISGGSVSLQSGLGTFIGTTNGGASLAANRWQITDSEKFTIIRVNGGTEITFGDDVAFRCPNGNYLTATSGGGTVTCSGSAIGGRQTFRLVKPVEIRHHFVPAPNAYFDAAGGAGVLDVEEDPGVAWTAVSNDGFITITSGWSGSGNGTVNYMVAPNYGPSRTGTITVDGATVSIIQAAAAPPDAPTGFVAQGRPSGVPLLSWLAAANATSYEVWRRCSSGGNWSAIGTTTATWYADATAQGWTCLYEVRSANGAGTSGFSNADLSVNVTFTDEGEDNLSWIKAAHISELRDAVDAVRALAGLSAGTYNHPDLDWVRAEHITDLRNQLTPALQVLGLPVPAFTDSTPVLIRKVHVTELRDAVR